jgi:hypothetical protein
VPISSQTGQVVGVIAAGKAHSRHKDV